jgi:hypothetical protein
MTIVESAPGADAVPINELYNGGLRGHAFAPGRPQSESKKYPYEVFARVSAALYKHRNPFCQMARPRPPDNEPSWRDNPGPVAGVISFIGR